MAEIKVRENGPYLVTGDDVTLVDWNGASYPIARRPFALCRCGASENKPFCDGSHKAAGFEAAEAAPGRSVRLTRGHAATGASVSNASSSPAASTRMCAPSRSSCPSMSRASGSSTIRCTVRFSGRAP